MYMCVCVCVCVCVCIHIYRHSYPILLVLYPENNRQIHSCKVSPFLFPESFIVLGLTFRYESILS